MVEEINNNFVKIEIEALLDMHKKLLAKCLQLPNNKYESFIHIISSLGVNNLIDEVTKIYANDINFFKESEPNIELDKEICKKIKFIRTILKFILELVFIIINNKVNNSNIEKFILNLLYSITNKLKLSSIKPFTVYDFIHCFSNCLSTLPNKFKAETPVITDDVLITNLDIILMVKLLHFTGNLTYKPKANLVLTSYSKTELKIINLTSAYINFDKPLLDFLNELKSRFSK